MNVEYERGYNRAKKKFNDKIKKQLEIYRYLEAENIKNKDNIEWEEAFNKGVLYIRIIWVLQELLEEE